MKIKPLILLQAALSVSKLTHLVITKIFLDQSSLVTFPFPQYLIFGACGADFAVSCKNSKIEGILTHQINRVKFLKTSLSVLWLSSSVTVDGFSVSNLIEIESNSIICHKNKSE